MDHAAQSPADSVQRISEDAAGLSPQTPIEEAEPAQGVNVADDRDEETVETISASPSQRLGQVFGTIAEQSPVSLSHGQGASVTSTTPLLPRAPEPVRRQRSENFSHRSRSKKRDRNIFLSGRNGWLLELTGSLLGGLLVATVVGLLGGFDGRAQPRLWKGITVRSTPTYDHVLV